MFCPPVLFTATYWGYKLVLYYGDPWHRRCQCIMHSHVRDITHLECAPGGFWPACNDCKAACVAHQHVKYCMQDLATEAAGKPLQPKQLAQALSVAQALADVLGASGGGATAGKQALLKAEARADSSLGGSQPADVVLVPDDAGVMRPAADLAFDDAPWLDGPSPGKEAHIKHSSQ